MSDYNETSELMTVCRQSAPGKSLRIGEDLFQVIQTSQRIAELSEGAFDITVGPVVRLWRRTRRTGELPEPKTLLEAFELTGYQKLHVQQETRSVSFEQAGMLLDLGGIAKGYAADEAMMVLKRFGIRRALIAAGGDILVSDRPPNTGGWLIGIAQPESSDAPFQRYVVLENQAVSTSGDTHQFVQIGTDRYSHIVDPRTGYALKGPASTVTVVAPNCVMSDSLATTASVLGPKKGIEFVEATPGAEALFLQKVGSEIFSSATKGWKDTSKPRADVAHPN
jgi:thiamine biosynthesis lipoprotein